MCLLFEIYFQWLENKKSRLPLSAIPWENIKPVVGKHTFPLIDNQMLEIVACPGHTPGSIAAYIPQTQEIFTGDTILNNKILIAIFILIIMKVVSLHKFSIM